MSGTVDDMPLLFACERFAELTEVKGDECACGLDADDQLVLQAIEAASDILAWLSNGRVRGVCTSTVRPVSIGGSCWPDTNEHFGLFPAARFGGMDTIPLPGTLPQVTEVVIDGVVLNPSEYGLLDNRYLFRREGQWPKNQDLRLLSNATGVFEVTFRQGFLDFISRQAAIELACELLKAYTGADSNLPAGVVSANIQGATVRLADELTGDTTRQGLERVQRFYNVHCFDGELQSDVWSPELSNGWQLVEVEGPAGS